MFMAVPTNILFRMILNDFCQRYNELQINQNTNTNISEEHLVTIHIWNADLTTRPLPRIPLGPPMLTPSTI